jgi:hypothetical protein
MGKYCPLHQICHPSFKCLWVQILCRSHNVLHSSQSLPTIVRNIPPSWFLLHSSIFSFLYTLSIWMLLATSANNGDLCPFFHLFQFKCKGALSIFMYFLQQIMNGSNVALTTCVQRRTLQKHYCYCSSSWQVRFL